MLSQKISAPYENRRTIIFTCYIFFNIVGTTVASQWWQAGGKQMASRWWVDGGQPTVGRRRQATEMWHRLTIGSLAVDRWWQFAVYSHWRTDGVVLSWDEFHILMICCQPENERGYPSQKCGLTPLGGQIQNGRQQNENKSLFSF